MTSHHPVLVGQDWRYPADLERSFPAAQIVQTIGSMFNLELSGHRDTVVLSGGKDAPVWPPLASCTVGKYLGKQFGYGMWTRRSTRCAHECEQCDAVWSPSFDPTSASSAANRFATYPAFEEVEKVHAEFWPATAESIWDRVGLRRDGQCHRSISDALAVVEADRGSRLNLPDASTAENWRWVGNWRTRSVGWRMVARRWLSERRLFFYTLR